MKQKIAVLGGGIMGLTCAYKLLKNGYDVHLIEQDDRLGGMAAHFDFSGLSIERYYHFFCKSDLDLQILLSELGLSNKLKWKETKMGYFLNNQLYDWGTPLALLKFPKLNWLSKLRYAVHMFLSIKLNKWSHLDKITAVDWIIKNQGRQCYNILWKSLFELKLFHYSPTVSAAWIWSRIKRIGTSRKNIFQERLGYIEKGTETLVKALEQKIVQLGGHIHLKSQVQKININHNQVQSVIFNNHILTVDKVISTVPLPIIPKIVPDLPKKTLKKYCDIPNIGVVCIILKLSKKVTDNFWLNINDPEIDVPGIIEFSNLRPLNEHIVYIPYYLPQKSPKFKDSDDIFYKKAITILSRINPKITEKVIINFHISRLFYAQPICETGFLNKLPDVQTPIKGLWTADTSYYYPEDRGTSESIRFAKKIIDMVVKNES